MGKRGQPGTIRGLSSRKGWRVAVLVGAMALLAGPALSAPSVFTSQGMAEYDNGKIRSAIADLTRALRQNPRDLLAIYYLANAYWRIDDNNQARPLFHQLAALDPGGAYGAQARDWLAANGDTNSMRGVIRLPSVAYQPQADDSKPGAPVVAKDGRLRITPPGGFAKRTDESGPAAGEIQTRLVFTRDTPIGVATLLVEARYPARPPSDADRHDALENLYADAGHLLDGLSIGRYDLSDTEVSQDGREQDVTTSGSDGPPMRGRVRGAWVGDAFVVGLALAPSKDWSVLERPMEAALSSVSIGPVPKARPATASASPVPTPTPTLDPATPWWKRIQSEMGTSSSGLSAPPWGAPNP